MISTRQRGIYNIAHKKRATVIITRVERFVPLRRATQKPAGAFRGPPAKAAYFFWVIHGEGY